MKYSQFSSPGVLVGFYDDTYNYEIYDFTSKKIIMSHHVTFNKKSFSCLKENPCPWLPEDFIHITSSHEEVVPKSKFENIPHLIINNQLNEESSEAAKGGRTELSDQEKITPGIPESTSEKSVTAAPHQSFLPHSEYSSQDQIKSNDEHLQEVTSDEVAPVSVEKLTVPRTLTRLRGNIPSYKGMSCDWDDHNLSHCFDIPGAECNGAVISTLAPRSYKKAMNSPD